MLRYELFAWHVFATIGTYSYILEVCTLYVNSYTTFFLFHMLFLQEEFDTHDPKAHHFFKLPFLKKWFQIVELGLPRTLYLFSCTLISMLFSTKVQDLSLLVSSPILWGTLLLNVLMTYKLGLNVQNINKKICFVNINVNEVIHNFDNKNNDSLIIILIYVSNNFNSLKCKTTPTEYVSYYILFSFTFITSSLDSLILSSYPSTNGSPLLSRFYTFEPFV